MPLPLLVTSPRLRFCKTILRDQEQMTNYWTDGATLKWDICDHILRCHFVFPRKTKYVQLVVSNCVQRGAMKLTWEDSIISPPENPHRQYFGIPHIDDEPGDRVGLTNGVEALRMKHFCADPVLWVCVYYWG